MLFLCNLLYLFVTPVAQIRGGFEQKKTVVLGQNIVEHKKCKKEFQTNFNKKEFVNSERKK